MSLLAFTLAALASSVAASCTQGETGDQVCTGVQTQYIGIAVIAVVLGVVIIVALVEVRRRRRQRFYASTISTPTKSQAPAPAITHIGRSVTIPRAPPTSFRSFPPSNTNHSHHSSAESWETWQPSHDYEPEVLPPPAAFYQHRSDIEAARRPVLWDIDRARASYY